MTMYEMIIDIIEKNGPISLSTICEEMNQSETVQSERKKPVRISRLKSVISRKKDIFAIKDDIVSIRQEKELIALIAQIGGYPGPSYKVNVDFIHNQFHFFEWYIDCRPSLPKKLRTVQIGSVVDFKREVYRLKIWSWERNYQPDTLLLDGTNWSVKLKTKGGTYVSEGLQSFPKDWTKFARAVSRLTGIPFH